MKKVLSLLLVMIIASAFLLVSCAELAQGNPGSYEGNQGSVNGQKQIPVYQGMTITSMQSTSELLYSDNRDEKGVNDINGSVTGDTAKRTDEIDQENPYPDNDETIEEEIQYSLNGSGATHDVYCVTSNEDVYINIHIDNPDEFEIISFTLNGEKYSAYMLETSSTFEKLVLKYNIGNAHGIVEYTIDEIKYVDGAKIKDVVIDADQTLKVGVRNDDQVTADVSNLSATISTIDFDVNITDKYDLVENSDDSFVAVLYDGERIVATKSIKEGENHVSFSGLSTKTLYQYAIVACYDDLSGSGFGSYIIAKNALYTEAVVAFDDVSLNDNNLSFTLAWNEKYEATLTEIKLIHNDDVIENLPLDTTSIQLPATYKTYVIVAKYICKGNTESIKLEVMCKYATPDFEIADVIYTNTSVNFNIVETDESNVGYIAKIELYKNGELYRTAENIDVRAFLDLAPESYYLIKVTYEYDLQEGEGIVTIVKSASFAVAHDHVWQDADCFTPMTCTICGATLGMPLGHTEVIDREVAPTCTKTGLTEGKHCSICNEILTAQTEVEALGHSYTSTTVAPTKTENGFVTYSCTVCSYSYTDSIIPENFTITSSNRRKIGYTGESSEELVIPDIFQDGGTWYRVTAIDDSAFYGCTSLTSVTIPDSVTSIGKGAFYGCTSLTNITIPDSVTSIPYQMLYKCSGLASVTIPDSVTSIGVSAFAFCSGLISVTIPDSVTSMDTYAFSSCHNLTSVTISNSLTSIGDLVFEYCIKLTSVTIPDGVTSIGARAFDNCTRLISVTLPDSLISIGDYAFYYCKSITNITIPDNVTTIGDYAFYYCKSITNITIPDNLTTIGDYAFYGCTALTSFAFNGTVEQWNSIEKASSWNNSTGTYTIYCLDGKIAKDGTIEYYSSYSTGLKYTLNADGESYSVSGIGECTDSDIIIPPTYNYLPVTNISVGAFSNCSEMASVVIPNSVTNIDNNAFSYCTNLTSINIPDSVTSIHNGVFANCTNLTRLIIPDSVTSIGECAFWDCSSLKSITIPDGVTSIGYRMFYKCKALISIIIPDSVTSIGYDAFAYCTSLTSVTIPDGVTSIGDSAFAYCDSLTSVTIPDSVTSIGSGAFRECRNLSNITFDGTVEQWNSIEKASSWNSSTGTYTIYCLDGKIAKDGTIEYYSFNSTGLKYTLNADGESYSVSGIGECTDSDIIIPPTYNYLPVTNIDINAFMYCSNLTSITIPDSVTSIDSHAFEDCTGLTSVVIPDSVTSIGKDAFYGCTSLTSVVIGNSVTSIGFGAFRDCSSLTSVTIPDSVTSIGDSAFAYCDSLTSVTIPDSVTSIGLSAFDGCTSLISVTIPDSVTSIGNYAFRFCTSLTNVTIPDSVTSIGGSAFACCDNLTSITIPDSVTSIGSGAFRECRNLSNITFNGTVEQWNAISLGYDWDENVPTSKVVCSDGVVTI